MSGNHFATGRCLCGSVTYTIAAAPIRMGLCHCDDCRRSSGTGHAANGYFDKKHVQIEGETTGYDSVSDTGSVMTRYFCPKCGSRLFGTSSLFTNIIAVSAGTLDDSSWFKPGAILYSKRRPVWDVVDESIPAFDEMPPGRR